MRKTIQTSAQSLIWISPRWPLPANDGARQATTQLLRHLCSLGVNIHLVCLVPLGELTDEAFAIRELGVARVTIISRAVTGMRGHLINLLTRPWLPMTVAPFATRELSAQVAALLEANPGVPVVFDGLHAGGWLLHAEPKTPFVSVYRAHNVERDLWVRGAKEKKNPLFKIFLRYQAVLVGRFEKSICARAAIVFPVSQLDVEIFKKMLPTIRARSLPIGITVHPVEAPAAPSVRELLFVGRMDWEPNREGLRWLLEKVWPAVIERSPDLRLTLVGSGNGAWLTPYLGLKGVKYLGKVESVSPHYASCVASIVPVFFGSGTRVKAIESSLFKRVCVGTALGVEGIGLTQGQDVYLAETADEWIETLHTLQIDEALERGKRACEKASRDFDPSKIASQFMSELESALEDL